MKRQNSKSMFSKLAYRFMLNTRWFGPRRSCRSFGEVVLSGESTISKIYIINLERQSARWNQIQRELRLMRGNSGRPLIDLASRFSAIDARKFNDRTSYPDLESEYTLSDQLFVEPNPLLLEDKTIGDYVIQMTRQEKAVAMSHIEVWKLIASKGFPYTLVLEDDAFLHRGFGPFVEKVWAELTQTYGSSDAFDILYLSYQETKGGVEKIDVSRLLYRPIRGLWQLSGYVLSSRGAKALLKLLPVRGPVDLWINQQFDKLDVFAATKSIIDQHTEGGSDNSYSVLPVLSKVGVLSDVHPSIFASQKLRKPVISIGNHGTGITSLAMALSMIGYRCCSDVLTLPPGEHDYLFSGDRRRIFDAYCNIGSLSYERLQELALLYADACFIFTIDSKDDTAQNESASRSLDADGDTNDEERKQLGYEEVLQVTNNVLILPSGHADKWDLLSKFLKCSYPISDYPKMQDQHQRRLLNGSKGDATIARSYKVNLECDVSAWIAPTRDNWDGIRYERCGAETAEPNRSIEVAENLRELDMEKWRLLTETFPGNLALFNPKNFSPASGIHPAKLTLRKEQVGVRSYTSASIASREIYQYGRFMAEMRPAKGQGLITGVFLHRNSPRQEIDIEFLGKDTSKMLANVYYNPGSEGSRFDYGYRGTPVLIDLGFDASEESHRYTIEWSETSIRWIVDETLVYERVNWNPTPVPHLPMHFYVNLWPSQSEELAGRLDDRNLPTFAEVKSLQISS